jgi:hypothetical protein
MSQICDKYDITELAGLIQVLILDSLWPKFNARYNWIDSQHV